MSVQTDSNSSRRGRNATIATVDEQLGVFALGGATPSANRTLCGNGRGA